MTLTAELTTEPDNSIPCEACEGFGFHDVRDDDDRGWHRETCFLCNGTGREPADVQARKPVEGDNGR